MGHVTTASAMTTRNSIRYVRMHTFVVAVCVTYQMRRMQDTSMLAQQELILLERSTMIPRAKVRAKARREKVRRANRLLLPQMTKNRR